MAETLKVKVKGRWYLVEVEDLSARTVRAVVEGHAINVDVGSVKSKVAPAPPPTAATPAPPATPRVPRPVAPAPSAPSPEPAPPAPPAPVVEQPSSATKLFVAPMPGTILSLAVDVGDQVVTGDPISVLEAMKMQQVLKADWSGVVKAVHVVIGQQVSDGTPIVELE